MDRSGKVIKGISNRVSILALLGGLFIWYMYVIMIEERSGLEFRGVIVLDDAYPSQGRGMIEVRVPWIKLGISQPLEVVVVKFLFELIARSKEKSKTMVRNRWIDEEVRNIDF